MNEPRVLVVDDTPELIQLVEAALRTDGMVVESVADGESALARIRQHAPDVVILDVMLPGIDGLETCRRLRAFSSAYVLMLTSRADEADRVSGLEIGADDYLTKPFAPRELVARVRALLRRPRIAATTAASRSFDDLTVDLAAREVRVDDTLIDLTRIEFDMLEALTATPRTVVGRTDLLRHVWGDTWTGSDHVVDVHMSNLRRKLGDDQRAERRIDTVRGVGFRFNG